MRWLGLALLVVVALLAINELRPVGAVAATQTMGRSDGGGGASVPVPWPQGAQAAIGAEASGVVARTPNAQPRPIASVAKVMTALVVLDLKPLQKGATGPAITVGPEDVAELQQEKADGQSVVPVEAGEQLSELQALQGLLIPSGNNIASMLARWAAGSVDAMVQRMNDRAARLGMRRTKFADASGFSPQTVSVPADLVLLGEEAMKDPLIADIVATPQVSLPVAGLGINVNYVLGQEGIVGVKTGNIPEGGAIYLFAAPGELAGGRRVMLFGAVQGLATLDLAFDGAKALLRAERTSLQPVHVVSRDQQVGRYAAPWGASTDVLAGADLDILVWPGTIVRKTLAATAVTAPAAARTAAGALHVTAGDATFDVPVATADQLDAPGRLDRLTRLTW